MKTITLVRPLLAQSEYATYGIVLDGHIAFANSLEPPKGKCIPPGAYKAVLYMSPKRKTWVYLLKDVPGFSAVEIHPGNLPQDTSACILVGQCLDPVYINGKLAGDGILESRKAFFELRARIGGDSEFMLEIVEAK
jgi:hypothetical protein